MGKKHKALVWGSIKLWKKESFIMERAAKIQRQTRKQKRSYHFSSLKWDQTVICLCPHFEQTLTLSVQTVFFFTDCILMEKNKNMFFSIVIALLSSTTVCLCWFSDYTVCCCVGERRAMASAYPQCSLFCSKVFWENINCMSNKGHRFNCPVWPGQPHPPTRTLYRACIHMHTQTWSVRWRWNFQEY